MNRFIVISLFLLVSCNSPEPYSEKWFEKELADPNSKYSEEFEVLAKEMANDEELKDKYSITTLLMTDAFLNLSSLDQYLKSLQICAANFSVMYGFMEAGIKMGETVTGLTDTDEMSRLSNEYVNHAYYFAVRGTEIKASDSGAANWDDNTLSYYEMKKAINDKEITKIQNEFYSIQSNETLVELLESNEQLCYQIRRQNPNNQDYRLD
jgi:hypothetical protein